MDEDIFKWPTYCVPAVSGPVRWNEKSPESTHLTHPSLLNDVFVKCMLNATMKESKRRDSSVAMMLLSFLLVGGIWRSGNGWFTGLSRAVGKRLSTQPTLQSVKYIYNITEEQLRFIHRAPV